MLRPKLLVETVAYADIQFLASHSFHYVFIFTNDVA